MDPGYTNDQRLSADNSPLPDVQGKLGDLAKSELIELIQQLERELVLREATLRDIVNHQVFYQSKYGRFGVGDPFNALQRDSANVSNDSFDQNQIRVDFDNQLHQLEALIETQRRAQAKVKEQKQAADERYRKVCHELEEAKKKYERDTARGDDVTVALEKDREKLQQDLNFTKDNCKKLEKELKRVKQELKKQMSLANKHKQVAMDLIKERRRMVAKLAESERVNLAVAESLELRREENLKTDRTRLEQLEAKMEKQSLEFDIEREQHKAKIRREEGRVRELVQQLTEIKETVLSLQSATITGPTTTVHATHQTSSLSSNLSNKPSAIIHVPLIPASTTAGTKVTSPILSARQPPPTNTHLQTNWPSANQKPVILVQSNSGITRQHGVVIPSATITSSSVKPVAASTTLASQSQVVNAALITVTTAGPATTTKSNTTTVSNHTVNPILQPFSKSPGSNTNKLATYSNQKRLSIPVTKSNVPPHLGPKAILENQQDNLAAGKRTSLVLNSAGNESTKSDLKLEPTSVAPLPKSGPVVVKPKPPPPVRNVSLNKKQYGSQSDSRSPSTNTPLPPRPVSCSTNSTRPQQQRQQVLPENGSPKSPSRTAGVASTTSVTPAVTTLTR